MVAIFVNDDFEEVRYTAPEWYRDAAAPIIAKVILGV